MMADLERTMERVFGPGNLRGSMRGTIIHTAKLALLLGILAGYGMFLTDLLLGEIQTKGVSSGFSDVVINYALMLAPTIVLSGPVGYYAVGSKRHMASRIVLNAYFIFALFMFAHVVDYSLSGLEMDLGYELVLSSLSVKLDITVATAILVIVPLCSMVDAVLEYLQSPHDPVGE